MLNIDTSEKDGSKRQRIPVAGEVARQLRQRIVEGIYRTHLYLPSERQLAHDFGTSRVTIANALHALAQEGLVMRTPGRGTRVLPALERLAQPRIAIVHGELPAMKAIRSDSLRTLQGARDALNRLNYSYELISVPQPGGDKDGSLGAAEQQEHFLSRFGAVLLIEQGYCDQDTLGELQERQLVVVVAKLEKDLDVCATWVDHYEVTDQAVRTFLGLGHRRIAFVGRDTTYGFHGRAREGYILALGEAGVSVDPSLIAVCEKTDALSAYFATRALLQLPQRPTAIVAARDAVAEGVCRAIEEADMIVGHHVSVIGFDDLTWPEGKPFLTTFREPCYEMGAAAAEMLVERIVGGRLATEKRKFEAAFVLRRSAGPCFARGPAV